MYLEDGAGILLLLSITGVVTDCVTVLYRHLNKKHILHTI